MIVPELETIIARASPSDMIAVIVETKEQGNLSALPPSYTRNEKVEYLKQVAEHAQRDLLSYLATVPTENVRSNWLVSRVCLRTTSAVIRAIAARSDVNFVMDDYIIKLEDPHASPANDASFTPGWNITKIAADSCWMDGYTGSGVVVGSIDTGVEVSHPAFGGRWRSSNGWFDGVNGQGSPYDDNGHGTHTMGTITGGDGLGPFADDIGVAPGANFICAKAFDAGGSGSTSSIQSCFDWMAGTGQPDVCSNSWGTSSRTSTVWFSYVQNLRGVGIVVVFSVGNGGPSGSTSYPPGSFPLCISAGATTASDDMASFSSRGPAPNQSPWSDIANWPRTDWNLVNPSVAAPGQGIRSAQPGGLYQNMDGTSMSCPHVAGAAALLLSKRPGLTHNEIFNLLADNADHVPQGGGTWPNQNYGWGRLNCKRALDATGSGTRPNILLSRTAVTGGNGNGRLDPGETANLITYVRNASAIQATNLSGRLRTSDAYITISDSMTSYGNVAGNDSTNNNADPFVVTAGGGCPQGHVASFTLYLACSETTWTKSFTLTVGQPIINPGTVIWGPRAFTGPPDVAGLYGICYNPVNDRVYVSHIRANVFYMYSSDSLLTALGTIPKPNGETLVTDLKYCAYDNTFWVASNQTKRVYKISATGTVLRYFANPANDYPTGLGWDESARQLYLSDRRALGAQPGYVYVTDTLGSQIRRMNVPLTANAGPRCLTMERTNSNPNLPTLLMAYTAFNAGGTQVDSVGVYEFNRDNLTILQRFLIAELYNIRGVEYDPRDANLWVTIMELAAGGPYNRIIKYSGFHGPTAIEEEGRRPMARDVSSVNCVPNPFRNSFTISFELRNMTRARVSIHDIAGREIAVVADREFEAGIHNVNWHDNGSADGVYFVNVRTANENLYHKVIKF
jgi:subtilisin family serine protease